MRKILRMIVLFVGNFTLGFIPYWLISPTINKGIEHFSTNLVLARELLIKMPLIAERTILELALINVETDHLISLLGLSQKNNSKYRFKDSYKAEYRGVF